MVTTVKDVYDAIKRADEEAELGTRYSHYLMLKAIAFVLLLMLAELKEKR